MKNTYSPQAEVSKNVDDCRQLAVLVFDSEDVGSQADITYAPLKKHDLNPFSNYFLRMIASRHDGYDQASISFVEHDEVNGKSLEVMGYQVDEGGLVRTHFEEKPFLNTQLFDWPTVIDAPQINDCIYNFKAAAEQKDVDGETLLKELMVVRLAKQRKPHISVKEVSELDVQEYSIDFLHRTHSMPTRLANSIRAKHPVSEWLSMVARYQGQTVLDATMIFDGKKQLIGITKSRGKDVERHIGALASFRRAAFN